MTNERMESVEVTPLEDYELDIVSGGGYEPWLKELLGSYSGWSYPLHIAHWSGFAYWSAPTTTDVPGAHA
jgi:hypothetical protein